MRRNHAAPRPIESLEEEESLERPPPIDDEMPSRVKRFFGTDTGAWEFDDYLLRRVDGAVVSALAVRGVGRRWPASVVVPLLVAAAGALCTGAVAVYLANRVPEIDDKVEALQVQQGRVETKLDILLGRKGDGP